MRKQYSAPIIEKVVFDYRVQISTASKECFGSIMNVATSESECGEGGIVYIGWDLKNPGQI